MSRSARRRAFRLARKNQADLRVIGRESTGFRLAIVNGGDVIPFGHAFSKQKLAVVHGERATGQVARKLLLAS